MEISKVLTADYANVSREGKLNVLGIFTDIGASAFPVIHPQMQLIVMWSASKTESGKKKVMEVQLREADGRRLFGLPIEFIVPEGRSGKMIYGNHIIALNGIKFDKPGDYAFHVLVNEDEKARATLEVKQVTVPGR